MKIKRFIYICLCIFFLTETLFSLRAAIPKDAVYNRKRLNTDYYLSPRALARGNTYITTTDQSDALFLNPAFLYSGENKTYFGTFLVDPSFVGSTRTFKTIKEFQNISSILKPDNLNNQSELTTTYKNLLGLTDKWKSEATSVYSSIFLGSFFKYVGFGVLTSATLDLDAGLTTVKSQSESVRVNSLITIAPTIGAAFPVPYVKGLQIGTSIHYLIRMEIDVDQGIDFYDLLALKKHKPQVKDLTAYGHKPAFDLGVVYKPDIFLNPRFGLVFSNIGNVNFKDLDKVEKFKMEPIRQNLGLGTSIHPQLGPGVLSVSLDFRDLTGSYDTSFLSETYFGVDYLLLKKFGFSTGLSQGYPSLGFYITSRFVQFDIGLNTKERELTIGTKPDTRFFLKLRISV